MFYGIAVKIEPIGNDTYSQIVGFIDNLIGDDVRLTEGGTSTNDPEYRLFFDSLTETNRAYARVTNSYNKNLVRKITAKKLTVAGAVGVEDETA